MTLCLYTDAATFTSFVDIHRRLHIVLANWDQTADCSIFSNFLRDSASAKGTSPVCSVNSFSERNSQVLDECDNVRRLAYTKNKNRDVEERKIRLIDIQFEYAS